MMPLSGCLSPLCTSMQSLTAWSLPTTNMLLPKNTIEKFSLALEYTWLVLYVLTSSFFPVFVSIFATKVFSLKVPWAIMAI